jgi:hypothetical protein
MKRWARLLVLATAGAAVALGAQLVQPGSHWSALALIGAAVALGELIELRPPQRAALPISFAFMVVLARRGSLLDTIIVVVVALIAATLVRSTPERALSRAILFGERIVEGMATVLVYRGLTEALGQPNRATVLIALFLSALTPIAIAEVGAMIRGHHLALSLQGRTADIALVSSAMLMAISDRGVRGIEGMGLWGPAVFTIPLLAAWYSYERLEVIRRTYEQTIRALGAAPELGGLVLEGHAERVAELSVLMGDVLGLSSAELEPLETAALLHHLGQMCLDEPEGGRSADPAAVAQAGAVILRSTALLAPAGDVIAAESLLSMADPADASALSGHILKVASAFDELSQGNPARAGVALEALYSGPSFSYDRRVLNALEVVLDRRGVLGIST